MKKGRCDLSKQKKNPGFGITWVAAVDNFSVVFTRVGGCWRGAFSLVGADPAEQVCLRPG
jgi:hypothetical protein